MVRATTSTKTNKAPAKLQLTDLAKKLRAYGMKCPTSLEKAQTLYEACLSASKSNDSSSVSLITVPEVDDLIYKKTRDCGKKR